MFLCRRVSVERSTSGCFTTRPQGFRTPRKPRTHDQGTVSKAEETRTVVFMIREASRERGSPNVSTCEGCKEEDVEKGLRIPGRHGEAEIGKKKRGDDVRLGAASEQKARNLVREKKRGLGS